MSRRMIFLATLSVILVTPSCLIFGQSKEAPKSKPDVRIGAVAYSPNVVTVFKKLRQYLMQHGFRSDYVLYSNYDSLVAALGRGEVDIAWNTPLAHAQYHVQNACASQTLVMRDVDRNIRSVVVARSDSAVESPQDLVGKKLVLGSWGSAEGTILPLHYLQQEGLELDEVDVVSLDGKVDFKGNPCSSPQHVLNAVRDGHGDAGVITERLWNRVQAAQSDGQRLKEVWTSPSFSHCVFTASHEFDKGLAERFTELMVKMDPSDPACADVMRLEGTKQWFPGSPDGFEDLVEALRAK